MMFFQKFIWIQKMPINVFGNSNSNISGNKIDTSLIVQRPYVRTNFIESNVEEDIDSKSQFRIKNLPAPISIRERASKHYVDHKFNDPTIIRNTDHVNFNGKDFDNVHSIKVNSFPTIEEHLTPKIYVDQALSDGVYNSSFLKLDPKEKKLDEQASIVLNSTLTLPKTVIELPCQPYVDNKFYDPSIIGNKTYAVFNDKSLDNVRFVKVNSFPVIPEHLTAKNYVDQTVAYGVHEPSLLRLDPTEKVELDKQDSIVLDFKLTSPKTIIEIPTKSNVDSLHESSRNGRHLSSVFNDQGNEVDNNILTNLDSVTVNRDPSLDNELSTKKHIDIELDKNTIVRFSQTLQNYLKKSVGSDTYNFTKYDKIQITDTTMVK